MKGYQVYSAIQQQKEANVTQRAAARALGLNRKTVKRYWDMTPEEYDEQFKSIRRGSQLDEYRKQILNWLCLHPSLSAAQVCDWLKEHYQAAFTERTVSRYVAALRKEYGLKKNQSPRGYEAVPELPMGQQVQVDFGEKRMPNSQGGTTKVYAAAFVLARSRYKYFETQSRPFKSTDLVNICWRCFRYFGGMPRELVFDQDSIVCVSENYGEIIYTYEFEKFRQQTGLSIYMCRKHDPESKGKIENVVKYIKGNFLSDRIYVDDVSLNRDGLKWLERTGNAKVHGATKLVPSEVFQEEQKHLLPIPEIQEAVPAAPRRTVRKDNTILYSSNRYSVPLGTYHQHPEVQIEEKDGVLTIKTLENELICEHRVSNGKGLLIQNRSHTRDRTTALDKLQEDLDKLLEHKATAFLQGIRVELPRYARDQFSLIQSLVDQFGVADVLCAIDFCQNNKLFRATVLRDFLSQMSKQSSTVPVQQLPAIPVDDPKYHVSTQKRSPDEYASLGVVS